MAEKGSKNMPPSETLGYITSQINDITVILDNAAPNVIHY